MVINEWDFLGIGFIIAFGWIVIENKFIRKLLKNEMQQDIYNLIKACLGIFGLAYLVSLGVRVG